MRHATIQQLSAFVDGALTGVSRDLVTRHLASCASCRERHAMWRIHDDVLQRVLAWEPDEHTMEEASTRVELTLTAERKGLPLPEFTPLLSPHVEPVSARPAPVRPLSAKGHSGMLPTPERMRQLFEGARPTRTEPGAVANAPTEPPRDEPAPESAASAEPAATTEHAAAAASRAHTGAPVAEFVDAEPAIGEPASASPLRSGRPHREDAAIRRTPRGLRTLLALVAVLLLVLLSTPFLPEVIRIPVPERWLPRLPRVEFVGRGAEPAPPDTARSPEVRPADRMPVEGRLVTDALAVVAESTRTQARAVAPEPAAPARPLDKPAPAPKRAAEPASGSSDHPVTVVPVRVHTEVLLAPPRRPRETGAVAPASPAPDTASHAEWPHLCGVVQSLTGAPLEGASIELDSPALTVRTDEKGRFCLSCPAGRRTLHVEAAGHGAVSRAVDLAGETAEVRITLSPTR